MKKLGLWAANKKTLIIAAVLILLVFMMMDLNTRLSELTQQNLRREKVEGQVIELKKTEAHLHTQIALDTSDQAVEEWAHEEGHMSLPGDQVIIPLSEKDITPTPRPIVVPTVQSVDNIQIWKALFFGN